MDEKLGDRLKTFRNVNKISQGDMAQKMGENQQTWSRYENNTTFPPKNVLEKLVYNFNFNLHWLITGQGEMFIQTNKSTEIKDTVPTIPKSPKVIPLNREVFPKHIPYVENENKIDSEIANDFKNVCITSYVLRDSSADVDDERQKELELISVVNEKINSSKVIQLPEALKEFENNIIAIIEKSDSMEPTVKKSALVVCDMLGFQGDGIYLIKLNGQYMVKRVSARLNTYLISSDNKTYESFEVPIGSKEIRIGGQVRCVTNIMY